MAKKRGSRQIKVSINRYIKENLSKGHSLNSIKKWLIMHGYDQDFASKSIKNFQRKQFAKKLSLSTFFVAITLLFVTLPVFNQNATGAVVSSDTTGCCVDNDGVCHESYSKRFCSSEELMYIRHDCFDLPYCYGNTMP